MRRRVQQILCGALIAGTVLASQPLPVFAETDTETVVDTSEEEVKADADYEIKVNEDNPDTAILVSYSSDAAELKIPEYIDGKKITEIGEKAFGGCKNVTSLELPDSVEILGGCLLGGSGDSLASLKLPAKEIKTVKPMYWHLDLPWAQTPCDQLDGYDYPFSGCSKLRNVEIPKGWTKVADYLFADCSGLENVEISDTVTELGRNAFEDTKISYVVIPDSVKTIDYECFAGCPFKGGIGGRNLQLINEYDYKYYDDYCGGENPRATFGDGTGTFYGYKGSYLEGWTIDHADYEDHEWETESEYSFVDLEEYEKNLDDYEIEANEEKPGTASIVGYNGNATELKIPVCIDGKVITEIGHEAFYGCESISSLEIPNTVEKLGRISFGGCGSLTNVKLPGKDLSVEWFRDIWCGGDYDCFPIQAGPFSRCKSLRRVELADGATQVNLCMFGPWSPALQEIVIPKTVEKIEYGMQDVYVGLSQLTVHGCKDSYSEKWAKEKGCKFVALEAEGSSKICGRNLSLDGRIGANVYVQVSDEILKDKDAYAKITIGDREDEKTLQYATRTKRNGETILTLRTGVKACETNEDICIQLFSSDGCLFPIADENGKKLEDGYTFTVAETARSYANAKSSSKKLKKLAKAILNYGIYAQKQQNYKADNLVATDDLSDIKKSSLKNYTVKLSGEISGLSYAGVNLKIKDDTGLYVYFKCSDPSYDFYDNLSCKYVGEGIWHSMGVAEDNLYYVHLDYIGAQELSKETEFVISNGKTEMRVKLSALSWARDVLNGKNYSKETVDLAKMIYRYSSAADEYFAK